MLSLDLFDSKFEKKLHEGALDDTVTRTQAHLMEPLSRRAADIRTQIRSGKLSAAELDKLEKEYEDLVQKRQDIIFNRKSQTQEQQQPVQKTPVKGIGDIQDPKQKMAQMAQQAKKGPLANVGAGLKAFIKGEPEPMDEEQQQNPRALGVANFQRLVKANMGNIPSVSLEFIRPEENFKLDQDGLDLISDYYDSLETDQAKNYFIYRVLPSGDETRKILNQLGWMQQPALPGIPTQGELPLQEKKKFKNNSDLETGDVKVARELQKLRAQYPSAKSDIEAVASSEIDSTERNQRQLAAIRGANEKQDALLKQLVDLDQEQGREIDGLDKENNSLEQRLAQVQTTNDRLQQAIGKMTGTKKAATATNVPPTGSADLAQGGIIDVGTPGPSAADAKPQPTGTAMDYTAQQLAGFANQKPLGSMRPAPGIGKTAMNDPTQPGPNVSGSDIKNESNMSELDIMVQDLNPHRMSDRQFLKAYGMSKVAFQQRYRTMLKPTAQQDVPLEENQRLHPGDPVVVTAPNEFEGATGEIYELSPSGKFVIVNLYNHGKHSMHLSDVEYNQYADADDEEVDEGFQDFNKVEPYAVCLAGKPVKKFDYYEDARRFHDNWKKKLYREGNKEKADKITLMPIMDEAANRQQQAAIAISMQKAGKKPKHMDEMDKSQKASGRAADYPLGIKNKDASMVKPTTAKKVVKSLTKDFEKAFGKEKEVKEDHGSWIVYDPETKQIKKRFKTHTAGKSYAQTHGLGFASSSYYFDNVKDNKEVAENDDWDDGEWSDDSEQHAVVKAQQPTRYPESVLRAIERNPAMRADIIADYKRKQGVAETVTDVRAGMAKIYHKLAPKIERHRDSFLAGQLYDELENYAELHGAEGEFKRMMAGARNRAHMEYDTNPGGFHNWFWFLPFENSDMSEGDEQLLEGIKDTASATAVIACLLAGGNLSGCATAPQQTTTAQIAKTGQDLGRIVYNARNITRAGTQEEAQQELRNILRGMTTRPEEMNTSNIMRIWQRVNGSKQQNEAKVIREDTAALAAEDAILKRIFVKHRDLMMEYGPDKISQAAESVAYDVGDIAHISDEQINGWVRQVEYILGARP